MALYDSENHMVEADEQECACCGEVIPEKGARWISYADEFFIADHWANTDAGKKWLAANPEKREELLGPAEEEGAPDVEEPLEVPEPVEPAKPEKPKRKPRAKKQKETPPEEPKEEVIPPPSLRTGGTMPLFPGADPALGIAVYREGGEVVLAFDQHINILRLTKDNAVLLRDHINLQQKHLGQQKGK